MDMPVPSVAEWDWLNWKFPRPVHAGDTIYARWTLTQKRPAVGGAPTSIVVWRVDVHTADGAMCAEGEVGASVTRRGTMVREPAVEAAGNGVPASRRRRRRRTTPASTGPQPGTEAPAPKADPPATPVSASATPTDRPATGARRRRRRRPAGASQSRNGDVPPAATPIQVPSARVHDIAAPAPAPRASAAATGDPANAISRVIRRLRRPPGTGR